MKKALIIFVLLALPITIYIIFATAVHHFSYLPIITEDVPHLDRLHTENDAPIDFNNNVSVLCFYGDEVSKMKGYAYNLHERIYKKNYIYKDFQIVTIAQKGQEEEAEQLLKDLGEFTDINMLKWRFVFLEEDEIHAIFNGLQTDLSLNDKNATPFAFIIDKENNLRGRQDKENGTVDYGYETGSIAALNNTMVEDVSILLAEYRLKESREQNNISKYEK